MSTPSRGSGAALRRIVVSVSVGLLAVSSCTQKESDFFTYLDSQFTTVSARVLGAPGGATVRLIGPGVDETAIVGATPHLFTNLPRSQSFVATVTPPTGSTCTPVSVTLNPPLSSQAVFTCTPGALTGTIDFSLTGSQLDNTFSMPISITGAATLNGSLGLGGLSFTDVPTGASTWSASPPLGFDCNTLGDGFTLAAGATYSQVIDCFRTTGTIAFTATGLSGSTTYPLTLMGPATLSGQFGVTGLTFSDAPTGNWTWQLGATPGLICNDSGSFTLSAGATVTQAIDCQPEPGTITATVQGATADVAYSGPSTGGAPVGPTPVPFSDLAPGTYSVSITDPAGYTCTPPTVQVVLAAGGNEAVTFTCTAITPVTYSLNLPSLGYTPGIVSGSRTGNLFDGGSLAGTYLAVPGGPGNNYYGDFQPRVGFDAGNSWTFRNFNVGGSSYAVAGIGFCATTPFSGANFLDITYVDDALQPLGTAVLSTGPGCFSEAVPSGTTGFTIRGNGTGSFDVNTLLVSGVSW